MKQNEEKGTLRKWSAKMRRQGVQISSNLYSSSGRLVLHFFTFDI